MDDNLNGIITQLESIKVIPVIKIKDPEKANPLADALVKGNVPVIEITMRTDQASQAIYNLKERKDIMVGAGTVLTVDQAKQAIDSGSKFLVTPGVGPKVIEYSLSQNIPIFPGVSSATDIQTAIDLGLKNLKFFPAEAVGGLKLLKALSAPFDSIKFIPTGGINLDNIGNYLSHSKVIACGGSWLATDKAIEGGDFESIEINCQNTYNLINSSNLA